MSDQIAEQTPVKSPAVASRTPTPKAAPTRPAVRHAVTQMQSAELSEGFAPPPADDAAEQQANELRAVQAQGPLTGDVHQAARHGISGAGGPLPHGDRIQAAFGAHDISGVRAHVGGPAAEASGAMGAEAYATGNDIAFRAAPSLHTAAHEAAHVVQQRSGVALKGGVGAVGDIYEQHADAVADQVVAGKSAEALLDAGPGGASSASGSAVQQRVVQRDGGSSLEQLATYLDDDDETSAISLMGRLSAAQVATVLRSNRYKDLAISCFGNEEMYKAMRAMGGDLFASLTWMFAEGTSVSYCLDIINRCSSDAQKRAVRTSSTMKSRFIRLCGNDEMRQIAEALGGDLKSKLEWVFGEGTEWSVVRALIVGASESDRAAVRSDSSMRGHFVSLCGNDEMRDAVTLLDGDLKWQLEWMFAEGTDWPSVRQVIEAAPEAEKAAVRSSSTMKSEFVSLCGNDEMEDAVVALGGDLKFKLTWMLAEGTSVEAATRQIGRAPRAQYAAVAADATIRDGFVSLCNDEEMATIVQLLGADLVHKVDWLIAEGTAWDPTIKDLINAATPSEKAATCASTTARDRFISLLGNAEMDEAVRLLGGDLRMQLDWTLREGTDWAKIQARTAAASEADKAAVRGDTAIRDLLVGEVNDAQMKTLVDLLGGDLAFKIDWLVAEGTTWDPVIKDLIASASEAEKAAARGSTQVRDRLVDLLGNAEMAECVDLLGGDLRFKLDWMFAEGTDWAAMKTRISAASDADKAGVRGDPGMRDHFVSELGNAEMAEAVDLLGGDLRFQLDWTLAEGTNWTAIKTRVEAAPEAEKASVRGDAGLRDLFVGELGNAEMAELVALLGGDLHFKLDWMFAEGTDWTTVKPLIKAAPEAEKAPVRDDRAMRGHFVGLLGNVEMAECVALLGGDLFFKLDWMFAEGTDWATVKPLIEAADETARARVRASTTMRDHFVGLLGNAEMLEAVQVLGGDLHFELDWMFAEGTDWAAIKGRLEAADEAGKARVRGDDAMRGHFVSELGDAEMKEAVALLGGDLHFKLTWLLAEGTTWAVVKALIKAAPEAEKSVVRGDAGLKDEFVGLLGNAEMAEAVALLGGDLFFKLDWMFAEGTDWATVQPLIEAADESGKARVRASTPMREAFVSMLGDAEMKTAVEALGGDLLFQLDWTMSEGTTWADAKALIKAAPDDQKRAVRESADMKRLFGELLGNAEMKEAVELLGGDLHFKLSWMLAEGIDWASVKALLEGASADGKRAVRDDLAMRTWFVDNLGNAQMAEAVDLLDGDLCFALSWTIAEGTTQEAAFARVDAAPAAEKAAVLADEALMQQLQGLVGNAGMKDLLDKLDADLLTRVRWMLSEGTDDAALRGVIGAGTPVEQLALINSTVLADVLDELTGSAITAFPALSDDAHFATAMGNPLMVAEQLELPAAETLTTLGKNPNAAAALMQHVDNYVAWISDLPAGSALSSAQRPHLRIVFDSTARYTQQWAIFEHRFGTDLGGRWASTLDPGDLGRLYTIMDRLPDAQIADNDKMDDLIRHFRGGGTYGGGTIKIGSDDDAHDFYDQQGRWKTLSQIAQILGVNESDVPAKVSAGLLQTQTVSGVVYYRLNGVYTKPDMASLLGVTAADVDTLTAAGALKKSGSVYRILHHEWKTAADMATHLGIPEADLAARVTAGQLVKATVQGVEQYAILQVSQSYFEHTVLHEIAHAVDDMLGGKTSIVYNWAGWKEYSKGSARQWADAMGGWGSVDAGDDLEDVKDEIADGFEDFIGETNAIRGPSTNLGHDKKADHALKKYARWPILQRAGTKMFLYSGSHPYDDGSYLYTANYYYSEWYRVKSSAVQYIPRDYARFSPAEWFADMYAEYYRLYDGTPATNNLKGGNVPGPVKAWFDANVDNLGRSPHAVSNDGKDPPTPQSGVSGTGGSH